MAGRSSDLTIAHIRDSWSRQNESDWPENTARDLLQPSGCAQSARFSSASLSRLPHRPCSNVPSKPGSPTAPVSTGQHRPAPASTSRTARSVRAFATGMAIGTASECTWCSGPLLAPVGWTSCAWSGRYCNNCRTERGRRHACTCATAPSALLLPSRNHARCPAPLHDRPDYADSCLGPLATTSPLKRLPRSTRRLASQVPRNRTPSEVLS